MGKSSVRRLKKGKNSFNQVCVEFSECQRPVLGVKNVTSGAGGLLPCGV